MIIPILSIPIALIVGAYLLGKKHGSWKDRVQGFHDGVVLGSADARHKTLNLITSMVIHDDPVYGLRLYADAKEEMEKDGYYVD